MLKIHQPYVKRKVRMTSAFTSIGALLLGNIILINSSSETSTVQAAEIKYMQQFTNPICQSMNNMETRSLIDPRGEKENFQTYRIVKLGDGRCWMQENLNLSLTQTGLSKEDTDIDTDWSSSSEVPSTATLQGTDSSIPGWSNSSSAAVSATIGNDNNSNYYSWCAATAGTCADTLTSNQTAKGSICPKGWKLPLPNEFYTLFGYNGQNLASSAASAGSQIQNFPYLFPAAGRIDAGKITDKGSGFYWSSRQDSSTKNPDALFFAPSYGTFLSGTHNDRPYYGFSVRCIADSTVLESDFKYKGDIEWSESKDGNVNVTMPTVITIDAASGMENNAEANKITEGNIIAKVTSNGEHEVLLNAMEPSLKDPKVNTAEISPASSTNPVQPGNNAWGIWNGTTSTYDPITTEAKTYYETITDGIDSQKIHTYQVGISISTALPAGTYATEVTVTASAK